MQNPDGSQTSISSADAGITALNSKSQVVGSSQARGRSGPGTGILFDSGNITRLLGSGYCSPFESSCFSPSTEATDINERTQVVGTGPAGTPSTTAPAHALLWQQPENNRIGTDLGTLGGTSSKASGINDLTQVVGTSAIGDNKTNHAFLWSDGQLTDLNKLIDANSRWELTSALEINELGQIIGIGTLNGQERGFLLSVAVPEPSGVLGLAVVGLLGLAWRFKRYRKN